jgi:hypothetical protein
MCPPSGSAQGPHPASQAPPTPTDGPHPFLAMIAVIGQREHARKRRGRGKGGVGWGPCAQYISLNEEAVGLFSGIIAFWRNGSNDVSA